MEESGSRRKQSKPAKLTTGQGPTVSDGPIAGGTVIGAFNAHFVTDHPDTNPALLNIADKSGRVHTISVHEESDRLWLNTVALTTKDEVANAVLTLNDNVLRLVTRKTLKSENDLLAIFYPPNQPTKRTADGQKIDKPLQPLLLKNHACELCGTRFSNLQTLNAHKANYCPKRPETNEEGEEIEEKDKEDYRKEFMQSSNTILLPVALTSGNAQIILGQPQTVIPVAVPENMRATSRPLLIQSEWAKGIHVDLTGIFINSQFSLPLAMTQTAPEVESRSKSSAVTVTIRELDRKPLDLTLKVEDKPEKNAGSQSSPEPPRKTPYKSVSQPSPDSSSTPKTEITAEPDKRIFVCEACGIKFSSLHTLKGHQQYYCKANSKEEEEEDDEEDNQPGRASEAENKGNPVRNTGSPACSTITCGHCEYVATNQSQLTQHNRSQHAHIQGYMCQLCGYKGYSVRGMKSHMKAHAESNSNSDLTPVHADDLLRLHVKPLPGTAIPKRPNQDVLIQLLAQGGIVPHAMHALFTNSTTVNPPALLCTQCKTSFTDFPTYSLHKCPCKPESVTIASANIKVEPEDSGDYDSDGEERHKCSQCTYKSPYKGNVKRHETLIHNLN